MVGSGKMGVALSVRLWLHDPLCPEVSSLCKVKVR